MQPQDPSRPRCARPLSIERLERRVLLAADGVVDDQVPCLFASSAPGDASRATDAINCFAFDLYEHFQRQQGNLFFSPLSIAVGLAMTYAGAAGDTAVEMEDVLHLGADPGIHASFAALLSSLDEPEGVPGQFELELANALWPQTGLSIREDFVDTIETNYGGEAQSLDYTNLEDAIETINTWVNEKTHGKIQDLIEQLPDDTEMVLTNSIYMKGLWEAPFDPRATNDRGLFHLEDGETIETPMMATQADILATELDGFQVLEMPFKGGSTSMVVILPIEQGAANVVTPQLLVDVENWLEGPRGPAYRDDVELPKFTATVSIELEKLLAGMGMPRAFGASADFSAMADAPLRIGQVRHKTQLEVTEQGLEAGAATEVDFYICFAAGTPILTPEGARPIEEIRAGDYVLSRNENDAEGKIEWKRVEKTFRNQGELVHLRIGGKTIRVTKGHRFCVKDRGWTAASEMRAGDLLATDGHGWMEVEQVTPSGEVAPVYNFQVADHHTYFVGSRSWGFAVWTHNLCGTGGFFADHPFHFLIRDNATSTLLLMGRISDPTQSENRVIPTVEDITGSVGDMDFNGTVNVDDIEAFVLGLTSPLQYAERFGTSSAARGDTDGDGDLDFDDIHGFLDLLQDGAAAVESGGRTTVRAASPDSLVGGLKFHQRREEPVAASLVAASVVSVDSPNLDDTLVARRRAVAYRQQIAFPGAAPAESPDGREASPRRATFGRTLKKDPLAPLKMREQIDAADLAWPANVDHVLKLGWAQGR